MANRHGNDSNYGSNRTISNKEKDPCSIFIGDISTNLTKEALESFCKKFGKVLRVSIHNRNAFITYETEWITKSAIEALKNEGIGRIVDFSVKRDQSKQNFKKSNDFQRSPNNNINNKSQKISSIEDSWEPTKLESSRSPEYPSAAGSYRNDQPKVRQHVNSVCRLVRQNSVCKCSNRTEIDDLPNRAIADVQSKFKTCDLCNKQIVSPKLHDFSLDSELSNTMNKSLDCFSSEEDSIEIEQNRQYRNKSTHSKRYGQEKNTHNKLSTFNSNKPYPKKSTNQIGNLSNAQKQSSQKGNITKSVFEHLPVNAVFNLQLQNRQNDGSWACVIIPDSFQKQYTLLFDEFTNACAGEKPFLIGEFIYDMLAVTIKDEDENCWYRALQLPDGSYAILDNATIANVSDLNKVVKCPEKFAKIPTFSCLLKPFNINQYTKTDTFTCSVIKTNNSERYIEAKDAFGNRSTIEFWPSIASNESHSSEADKPQNHKRHKINKLFLEAMVNRNKSDPLKIENKDSVIIVGYSNSKCVYIRKIESEYCYANLLDEIHSSCLDAPTLRSPPEISSFVAINFEKHYYRGCVKSYIKEYDSYKVFLQDIGKTVNVNLNEMKKIEQNISHHPNYLTCVSLANNNQIFEEEPMLAIRKYIQKYIREKIPVKCMFSGQDSSSGIVTLISETTEENINNEIAKLARPVMQYLIDEKMNIDSDLPVIEHMASNFMELDVTASVNDPVKLIPISYDDFMEDLIFTCTPASVDNMEKFAALHRRINAYCKRQKKCYMPEEGELCLVFHETEDTKSTTLEKIWSRAIAEICNDPNNIYVYHVDTGICSTVTSKDIRKIIPEFVEALPYLGTRCALEGISKKDSKSKLEFLMCELERATVIQATSIKKLADHFLLRVPQLMEALNDY